ncbi:hypothetical protein [Streptomyces sp. B6B3]|uniref:hypothetical protein n=1 Tax=Streptomyces sp. B6B3 TaxID=3153570 RepID=UPI00325C8641
MLVWLVTERVKDLGAGGAGRGGGPPPSRTTVYVAEKGVWRGPARRRGRRAVGWLAESAPEGGERESERADRAARLAARDVALWCGESQGEPAARVRRARLATRHAEYEITDADGELLAAVEHRYGSLWRLRRPRWTVRAADAERAVVGRQGRILLWWLWWPSLPLQLATYVASYCQLNPIQVWHPLSIRLRGRWRRQVMRYRPRRELLQVRDHPAWDERVVAGLLYLVERPLGAHRRQPLG